jgi:hypothetical protein
MISHSESDPVGNPWTPEIPFEILAQGVGPLQSTKLYIYCFLQTLPELDRKASLEEELDNLMDISIGNIHYRL